MSSYIDPTIHTLVSVVSSLTDSSGGTAANGIQAITAGQATRKPICKPRATPSPHWLLK